MAEQLLVELLFFVPGSPITARTIGATAGREYFGSAASPAPRVYAPRVIEFVNFRRDAVADGKTFGKTDVGGGVLRLANPDGFYDELIDLAPWVAWFRLVSGTEAGYASNEQLLFCLIDRLEFTLDGEVRVILKDASSQTDVPIQTRTYLGTNSGATGVEGLPDDLQGRPVVDAWGYVFQAPIPFVNTSARILQLDSQAIQNIATLKVYDGLVGITRGTARASLAALQAGTPGAGTFDYFLGDSVVPAGAYIKLGTAPTYTVTADIEGKIDATPTFMTKPGQLFWYILVNRANVNGDDIDEDDLDELLTTAPYDLGMWIDSPTTVREVLDRIATSIPGWWGVDRNGKFRLRRMVDPSSETPVLTFKVITPTGIAKTTDGDVVSIERLGTNDFGNGLPAAAVRVYYKQFGQVTDQGFDTAATLATRMQARAQWRSVVANAPAALLDLYPAAPTLEFETALVNEADAETVAQHLLSLYSVRRDRYRITVRLDIATAALVDLGVVVELDFNRFDLAGGKNFVILGMRYRGASEEEVSELIDMDIWG